MLRLATENSDSPYFPLGFPLSRKAWNGFSVREVIEEAAGIGGNAAVYALRMLADRINAARSDQEPSVHAGHLIGMALITEILRHLVDRYCLRDRPGTLLEGIAVIQATRGPARVEQPARAFVDLYPPRSVLDGRQLPAAYLAGTDDDVPRRYTVSRELILLALTAANPALAPNRVLYDDAELKKAAAYERLIDDIDAFFKEQPPFPGTHEPLLEFLRAPMRACPHSIEGQLDYIRTRWAEFVAPELLDQLQFAADVLRESFQMRGHGPGPAQVLEFGPGYHLDWGYPEPAAFTLDLDWMSNVVLIAKSVYVWLDQLSRKYQRAIVRLDQIPDEELDRLARWGFTGLWLIGVWERSPASQKIKQIMGNPEALPSAYSLYDYVIAGDLGGEAAYASLRDRAWQRGIRLASDMVPNHVGLYSRWVIEHPDWFIQSGHPPYPAYRFDGPDLSLDPRVGLYIDDGYWEHRDAAVVFKRVDRWTGDVRYIYHGNDGTNMPWNDTAQLNFLIPEVREAVIQTILHVARRFPIIRFDAAMTLAKRHYQRLWFPKPGDAGAVPSRAEHGMTKARFDEVFPAEFWREVVDRIKAEAPDTLLLAEAFWLMEGYFVRTLGMHRVYNSAFMNMLKMEENSKYRTTVKNVLEFSPEVLKRFVNFMNNPDERSAVEQFGKGDKYYGVAVMMATMPGLPMFGHGQIEGFTEKYGMEYRRAYWDEPVDDYMVARHEAEIFPLMRKRHLFSGAENFAFFDVYVPQGWVDENVFAYTNRAGGDRALILYNNAYSTMRGCIHHAVPASVGDADTKALTSKTIMEALALDSADDIYHIFREHRTKLEYVVHAGTMAREGFHFDLGAYEYRAYLDFKSVRDFDGSWWRLAASLGGRGVPSVEEAYKEQVLEPIRAPFRNVMSAEILRAIATPFDEDTRAEFVAAMLPFLEAVAANTGLRLNPEEVCEKTAHDVEVLHTFAAQLRKARPGKPVTDFLLRPIPKKDTEDLAFWRVPLALAIMRQVLKARSESDVVSIQPPRGTDEWLLAKIVASAFEQLGAVPSVAYADALLVKILADYPALLDFAPGSGGAIAMRRMFDDPSVQQFLCMNRYEGVLWLNKEQMERLVYWLLFASLASLAAQPKGLAKQAIATRFENASEILNAVHTSGYRVEESLALLALETPTLPDTER